jgi:hypothetical protein
VRASAKPGGTADSTPSAKSVLFLRSLSGPGRSGRPAAGTSFRLGPHLITVFWVGFGRRPRLPGPVLLERLRGGSFTDVVDIGIAGALDPRLKDGDLVLSTLEVPFDSGEPLDPRRRPEMRRVALGLARERGVSLRTAAVLTHEKAVLCRRDRLGWFERTGCAAVQMEHAWGLQLLRSLLPAPVFRAMCFTHLVLISDAVPAAEGWLAEVRSGGRALGAYVFQRSIRRLRRDFLIRWLAPGGMR